MPYWEPLAPAHTSHGTAARRAMSAHTVGLHGEEEQMQPFRLAVLALLAIAACAPAASTKPSAPAAQQQAPAAQPPAAAAPAAATAPAGAGSSPAASTTGTAGAANPYLARPGEAPIPVRVATCAVSGGFVHLYTALDNNLFEKYGLKVEHTVIAGSGAGPSLAALSVNEIQFLYCAADATIGGLASGIDAKVVGAPLVGLVWLFITRPEVKTMADLRGKAVGVPRVGDLADRLSRLVLEKHGLRPNQDVDIRPTGGSQPERYQAMVADIVQGNVFTPPLDAQARRDGMNVLYDLADLGIPSIYSSIHASNTVIREHPDWVGRFVAAMAEAVYFTEKNPEAARQSLRNVLKLEDSAALDSAYQAYAVKHVNRRMSVPLDAVSAVIADARAEGTNVTVRGPEDVATNTFVDDLDRTGFLQQLWGAELPPR